MMESATSNLGQLLARNCPPVFPNLHFLDLLRKSAACDHIHVRVLHPQAPYNADNIGVLDVQSEHFQTIDISRSTVGDMKFLGSKLWNKTAILEMHTQRWHRWQRYTLSLTIERRHTFNSNLAGKPLGPSWNTPYITL